MNAFSFRAGRVLAYFAYRVAVMAKDVAEAKRTVFHPRLRLAWLSALRHAIQVGCSYGAESEDIADVT